MSQDVSKLQTNLASKNLIKDMENQHQICTYCESEGKPHAVVYCQDCGRYLCTTCHNTHTQWKGFISHEVIAMSEISSGKVSVRRYRKCRKHPKEDEECFCTNCRKFACLRCVVMEHKDEGHRIIEAAAYERSHMKTIEDLKSKVDKKRSCFQKYVDYINEQEKCVSNARKQCTDDINRAYDDLIRRLTEKRKILLDEVKTRTAGVKELNEMKKSAQKQIIHLNTIADILTNRTKVLFDTDTLAAHDTLCKDLQEVLSQEDPVYEQARKSGKKGQSIHFQRNIRKDELDLGNVVNLVAKNIASPTKDFINVMASTPDGRMAVGNATGGVNIFSADAQLQHIVLIDVEIHGLGYLSDDRCAVIDSSNTVTLYTPEYTKLNVMFETLSYDEGGWSTLTVDGDDQIYVSYMEAMKIQVFSPAGGKAIREIPCHGYEPEQISSYKDSLITKFGDTIRLIDKEGVKHGLTGDGSYLCAAVSQWNTILIATVKHDEDLVSIDEYTHELEHVQNLVNDFKIEKPERRWYYLQQYQSERIAFCTPNTFHTFY